MKNKPLLLPLLILFSLLFISTSIYVFFNSSQLLHDLKKNVKITTFAHITEDNASNIHLDMPYYTVQGTNERIDEFVLESTSKAKEYDLTQLTPLLKKLETATKTNVSGNQEAKIKKLLRAIKGESSNLIHQCRKSSFAISEELSSYWSLTSYLLVSACLVLVLFVFSVYYGLSSNTKLGDLMNIKSLLLDKSSDAVVSCDKQGRIIEFNRAAEKFFGYTKKEVVKKSISFLYADLNEARKVKEAMHFHEVYKGEIKIRRKNGELFTAHLVANIIRNEQGQTIGSMGIARHRVNPIMEETVLEKPILEHFG